MIVVVAAGKFWAVALPVAYPRARKVDATSVLAIGTETGNDIDECGPVEAADEQNMEEGGCLYRVRGPYTCANTDSQVRRRSTTASCPTKEMGVEKNTVRHANWSRENPDSSECRNRAEWEGLMMANSAYLDPERLYLWQPDTGHGPLVSSVEIWNGFVTSEIWVP